MQCPQCRFENRQDARFCLRCGTQLTLTCRQCNTTLPPDAVFCDTCGARVSAPPEAEEEPGLPPFDRAIQRLVPQQYADRLLASQGQVPSARRIVTILFSDVTGSTALAETMDPEDWTEIMDGAFDVLIGPIYRYEGTLARLMGDAILAFFGAPFTHEDDPERACRAALEIVHGAQRYASQLEKERGVSGFDVQHKTLSLGQYRGVGRSQVHLERVLALRVGAQVAGERPGSPPSVRVEDVELDRLRVENRAALHVEQRKAHVQRAAGRLAFCCQVDVGHVGERDAGLGKVDAIGAAAVQVDGDARVGRYQPKAFFEVVSKACRPGPTRPFGKPKEMPFARSARK